MNKSATCKNKRTSKILHSISILSNCFDIITLTYFRLEKEKNSIRNEVGDSVLQTEKAIKEKVCTFL